MKQSIIMFDTVEDLLQLTGIPDRDTLWDRGFNLDDWDAGFCTDKPLEEYSWLNMEMENYCVGSVHVVYNGKHYYTVHHA